MKFSLPSFRRITNSGNFIPEIDGLRFLAIALVVLYHLDGFLFKELTSDYKDNLENYNLLHEIMLHGYFGVEIFFCISAFVVSYPFAKYYLADGSLIQLKDYFYRRITRIEPPYIISLLLILAVHLFLLNGEKMADYIPSFYYSLFYVHGFFYHRDFQPFVNNVTWSLEIEIQFYILAPLLFYFFFRLKKHGLLILLISTLLVSMVSKFPKPDLISLYEYFHFFLLGMAIAYMKAKNIKWSILEQLNIRYSQEFISGMSFILMLVMDITFMGPLHTWFKLIVSSFQMFFMFVVFYNLLISAEKKVWINRNFFTAIGGMCYSIYLFHNQLIVLFGQLLLKGERSSYFIWDYFKLSILLTAIILFISSVFFILIERPCMDKNWPKRLLAFIYRIPFRVKKYLVNYQNS
ncbi:MAG: acyltransferase [Saprospiraceae bacterium]